MNDDFVAVGEDVHFLMRLTTTIHTDEKVGEERCTSDMNPVQLFGHACAGFIDMQGRSRGNQRLANRFYHRIDLLSDPFTGAGNRRHTYPLSV